MSPKENSSDLEESVYNGELRDNEYEAREAVFKEGISSIFAKKKTKGKEAEEEKDSGVTAILDVFGNAPVGRVTRSHRKEESNSLLTDHMSPQPRTIIL